MAVDGSLIFDTGLDSSGFTKDLAGLKTAAVTAATAITVAFTGAAAAAVNVGTAYTSAMSQVAATMGITSAAEDYAILSTAAKEMGASTKYSASQAADALNYLALAGYDAQQSVSALPTVLNLAAAGGIDLAYASDMVTDSMSALGLGMDQLEGFADQLAKTSQKSNTSVAQLGEAILTVGGTAKSLAGGVNELNTMLGVIADNGVKGAEGGTALRNVILSLSAPTDTAAKAMANLGVSAYDLNGNLRYLPDVFADFNTALSSLSESQKSQILSDIFNKVDLKTVNALLGTSAERFDELAGYIADCDGAAAQMAETMSDNLEGDMLALQSALEGVGIAAFEKFESPMRTAVQSVTADLANLNSEISEGGLSESLDKISEGIGSLISKIGEFAADKVLPAVISGMTLIIEHGGKILALAAGITTAVKGMQLVPVITSVVAGIQTANLQVALLSAQCGNAAVATTALSGGLSAAEIAAALFTGKITLATAAQAAFNAVASVNPFVWVAAALSVVVTAVGMYIAHVNSAKAASEEFAEETNEYAEAMEKVRQTGQDNIDQSNSEIAVIKEKAARYEELRQRCANLTRGEMAELKELAVELQGILPEGTEIINEQTGAYNSLADSIERVCQNMDAQALLNAKHGEYEEAVRQNDDLQKQLNEIQKQYDIAQEQAGLYEAEGLDVNEVSSLDKIAMRLYGMSYDNLVKQKESNQKIIDEYHQLYSDTYEAMNPTESEHYDPVAEHRRAGMEYANGIIAANEATNAEIAAKQAEATKKLEKEWSDLNHKYNTGVITSEKELYAQKKAILDKYGDETLEDHWKYYEELYGYEQDFAEESAKLEQERLDEEKKLQEDARKKQLEDMKDSYKKQLEIVKGNISDTLSEYKKAMSELESNIAGYKNKLLSVGDIFSVSETEVDGKKVKTYTVENIKQQMEEMKKYHSYVKSLKAAGAADGLLSELTSLDFEDGAQFGKYLSGLSDSEFAKINEYYKERDALADELANDLYAGEAEKINNALMSCMDNALSDLEPKAQEVGRQLLEDILSGMDMSNDDISAKISNFSEGFSELMSSALEDMDLENGFSVAFGGINARAMGQELAHDFASGFNEELAKSRAEITVSQRSAAVEITSGSASVNASAAGKTNSNAADISAEDVVVNNTVVLDGEVISRRSERKRAERKRRTGT